jgi:hypothetical protein
MSALFASIKQGLNEAIAHQKGSGAETLTQKDASMKEQNIESVFDLFEPHQDKAYDELPEAVRDTWNRHFGPATYPWDEYTASSRMALARQYDEQDDGPEYEAWEANNWELLVQIGECESRISELQLGPCIDVAAKHKAIDELEKKIITLKQEQAKDFIPQARGERVSAEDVVPPICKIKPIEGSTRFANAKTNTRLVVRAALHVESTTGGIANASTVLAVIKEWFDSKEKGGTAIPKEIHEVDSVDKYGFVWQTLSAEGSSKPMDRRAIYRVLKNYSEEE